MKQAQTAKNTVKISIEVEEEGNDYHDLALRVLETVTVKLCGGYYEPKSNRDAELGKFLYNSLQHYKCNL